MAAKRHLLEALSERNRLPAAPPPRPASSRSKKALRTRPEPLSIPLGLAGVAILGSVAAIVLAYNLGRWRGGASKDSRPEISAKAPDPLAETEARGGAPPSAPTGPPAAVEARFRVQVITYDDSETNRNLARTLKHALEGQGFSDVGLWLDPGPKGNRIVISMGAFAAKDDAALADLLARIRRLPYGRESAPFRDALVRQL